MSNYILCEDNKKAYKGDRVRVVGKPKRFFYDDKVDIEGVIKEIGFYEDDEYFGFILEDTNKFYVMDCEEIYLID